MAFPRDRRTLLALSAFLVVPAAYLVAGGPAAEDGALAARVQRGPFAVSVTTSGELQAREAVSIRGPGGAQQIEIYQIRIATIVPEGTVVDSGDVVAQLDRSQVQTKFQEVSLALEKAQAVYEQAMLDSTLTLSQARDEIRNLELALEEKRLEQEQAQYEPPTVQRRTSIELERAQRQLDQARVDYTTKVEQARAKMREVGTDLERQRQQLGVVQGVMDGFTVRAPAPGMVIYVREWNGRKRTTGSQVSAWDPTVATLPDLTLMESKTYVNEVDIRKVAPGQPVKITLDSDPTKKLEGEVTQVANVGEQRPNSDAKVFEVLIQVAQQDTALRPGMTTGNAIETGRFEDVLFIPIEALGSENGIPFVYRQNGGSVRKREVVTGPMNESYVIVERGLEEGDHVLLVPPPDGGTMDVERLEGSPVQEEASDAPGQPTGGSETGSEPQV